MAEQQEQVTVPGARRSRARKRDQAWREEQVARLLPMDQNGHWLRRLRSLIDAGKPEALALGERLLHGETWRERRLGADLLGQLVPNEPEGTQQRIGAKLVAALAAEPNCDVIASIVVSLGHGSYAPAADAVLGLADHSEADVRWAVAHALTFLSDDERVAAALRQLSRDEDPEVRDWATFELGAVGPWNDADTLAALIARTDDRHTDTRCEAIFGLARRHHPLAAGLIDRELRRYWKSDLIYRAREALDGELDPDLDPPAW